MQTARRAMTGPGQTAAALLLPPHLLGQAAANRSARAPEECRWTGKNPRLGKGRPRQQNGLDPLTRLTYRLPPWSAVPFV